MARNSTVPPLAWWRGVTRQYITRTLENQPYLSHNLRTTKKCFISWATNQYIGLLPHLIDVINDFNATVLSQDLRLMGKDLQELRLQIFQRDHFTCAYCGQVGGILEIDHIIPISRGGFNQAANLTTACVKCNRQKRTKTPPEYYKWRKNKDRNIHA